MVVCPHLTDVIFENHLLISFNLCYKYFLILSKTRVLWKPLMTPGETFTKISTYFYLKLLGL